MTKHFALLADLHLHPWSSFASTDERGVNTRLAALLGEIKRASKEVKEAGGDIVIFAGDVFHVRGSVSPTVLNATIETLALCHELYAVHFVIIPGNHDLEGKDSTKLGSAVTALECSHVTVLNSAGMDPRLGIYYVPWFEKVNALKAELERIDPDLRPEYSVIMHAPIDGVIPGLPMHGLDPEYLASLGYKRIFAGHYHDHKLMYGGLSGSMTYDSDIYSIGALAHHTWSDVGSKAGFLIVAPDSVRWMKSHLPEFIDLTRMVDLEPDDIPMLVDQNFVRVRTEHVKSKEIEEVRQSLLDMGARAVLVQPEPKPAPVESRPGVAPIKAGASLESSVTNFIGSMGSLRDHAAVAKEAMNVLGSVSTLGA